MFQAFYKTFKQEPWYLRGEDISTTPKPPRSAREGNKILPTYVLHVGKYSDLPKNLCSIEPTSSNGPFFHVRRADILMHGFLLLFFHRLLFVDVNPRERNHCPCCPSLGGTHKPNKSHAIELPWNRQKGFDVHLGVDIYMTCAINTPSHGHVSFAMI